MILPLMLLGAAGAAGLSPLGQAERTTTNSTVPLVAARQMENLGRGIVAINEGEGSVYVGWRLLGADPEEIAFNVYRATDGKAAMKLNAEPLTKSTDFVDRSADVRQRNRYFV